VLAPTGSSVIRSGDSENPTLEPNTTGSDDPMQRMAIRNTSAAVLSYDTVSGFRLTVQKAKK